MADSFNKKEREKKRRKKQKDKAEKMKQRKLEGIKPVEFQYVDEDGNLQDTPPDPLKKKKFSLEEIHISTPKSVPGEPMSKHREGVVKFFNDEKGYGFIVDNETKDSVFVHIENVTGELKESTKVSFEIGNGPKGPIALVVKVI